MDNLYKKGLRLEYFTVSYNILEATAALILGGIAASVALIGFGFDSIIESLSGIILIWRLTKGRYLPKDEEEKIERKATKFVAITFFILAFYISIVSILSLVNQDKPDSSIGGIILAVLSLMIMPILAREKMKVARALNSRALIADAKETLACAALAAALLSGLLFNFLFGFWQADPIAGLIIVYFLLREGIESWKGNCECE